jgi:UDP-glucose 4-epimerase
MKKILVTGGAGFIGSNLVSRLVEKGHSVIVLDNLSSGKLENLSAVRNNPDFHFIRGDIQDKAALHEAFCDVDAVVHLAALIDVSASVIDPSKTHEVNVTGTLNLLQAAEKANSVNRFVFASSTAVYGDAEVLPIKENTALRPISPYAASKVAGEAYCNAFTKCHGLSTVILRFFNVYGPRNEKSPYSGVITKFLRQAVNGEVLTIYGDGKQTRNFIHINDVVDAIVLALDAKEAEGEVFNVCTGRPISINKLVDAVRVATGRDLHVTYAPARRGEIKFSHGDPSKATEKLKFTAKVSLQEGLNLLIKSTT